jgi:putative endonuclease
LVFYNEFNEIDQAIAFEKQVKGWSRKKKKPSSMTIGRN